MSKVKQIEVLAFLLYLIQYTNARLAQLVERLIDVE